MYQGYSTLFFRERLRYRDFPGVDGGNLGARVIFIADKKLGMVRNQKQSQAKELKVITAIEILISGVFKAFDTYMIYYYSIEHRNRYQMNHSCVRFLQELRAICCCLLRLCQEHQEQEYFLAVNNPLRLPLLALPS